MPTSPINGLFVERIGTGTPLLLMHGGMGFDHTTFRPGFDALADHRQVIYYDHRGNGRSARPRDWTTLDHESWIRDAEELRRGLHLDRVVLFGHSYGGFLAQEYALRHPDSVAGLILCCTAPVMDHGPTLVANARARGTAGQVAALNEALSTPLAGDPALDTLMRTIGPLYFHRPDPDLIHQVFGETRFSAEAFNRAFFGCVGGFDTTERLGEIHAPTLLLAGDDDWIMPPEPCAQRLSQGLPDAELHVFERSGHFPWAEQPDRFKVVVEGWLDRFMD